MKSSCYTVVCYAIWPHTQVRQVSNRILHLAYVFLKNGVKQYFFNSYQHETCNVFMHNPISNPLHLAILMFWYLMTEHFHVFKRQTPCHLKTFNFKMHQEFYFLLYYLHIPYMNMVLTRMTIRLMHSNNAGGQTDMGVLAKSKYMSIL